MRCSVLLLAALALGACSGSPSEPQASRVTLLPRGDSILYIASGSSLNEPLQVFASQVPGGSPARNVSVTWRVTQGALALVTTESSTDSYGIASAWTGQAPAGVHRVTASSPRVIGRAPVLEVRVVERPRIDAISPALAEPGAVVTIRGENFGTAADLVAVYFDGVRGNVVSVTPTELRVEVPRCVPERAASVAVGLGAVLSVPRSLALRHGGDVQELLLAPGAVALLGSNDLACIRLPAAGAGAVYLLGIHNIATAFAPRLDFQVRALTPSPQAAAPLLTREPRQAGFASDWEMQLRSRERQFGEPLPGELLPMSRAAANPVVGERRQFSVLDRDNRFRKINAEVRHISARAIFFLDVDALDAYSPADLAAFGTAFDDPIYPASVEVFGEPSDLDGNQRIIVLFTPRVNELTPRGQSSFIAGYFYGCDLVSRARCSGSNQGEIFYSIVPDPAGKWGDTRSHAAVMNTVPPVFAHEFQHMINFARRGFTADALWLSEALAHTAEELIADVFAARGAAATAAVYRTSNYFRAQFYLSDPGAASMIAEEPPGSLELRGAAWLFLRYLRAHYGGDDLLRRLTASSRSGAANVAAETGRPWAQLVAEFGVALYADGAPELEGQLPTRYGFGGFDLRRTLAPVPGGYTLRPRPLSWVDAQVVSDVSSASHEHFLVTATPATGAVPLTFIVAGRRGAPISTSDAITVSVTRLR